MAQKVVLIITDGIGHNPDTHYNAFAHAKKPAYDWLFANVPHSLIHTYGMHAGLPDGQMGNSEVGHMTLGSGRILYQDLVKINQSIENDTLKDNPTLQKFFSQSKRIHLCGLLSDGGVHSHIDHFIALTHLAKAQGKSVFLHLITDGRDVLPKSAQGFIEQILPLCDEGVKIATIGGRFYGMDRDKRWERVREAYECIVHAKNPTPLSPTDYIAESYAQNITDEFILPASFGDYKGLEDNDGFLFINFRSDRARELIASLDNSAPDFSHDKKLSIATMTEYDKTFTHPVLFPKEDIKNSLAEVLSTRGLTQAHVAETEKYAHVTFFFNGGIEEPFLGEMRALIPSPQVKTYDLKPEMSAEAVGASVRKFMEEGVDFIVVNFANGDMVGHTGNFQAAIKAVEAVDSEIGKILDKAKNLGYGIVLTSDHGNCEEMQDKNGQTLTNHTVGDVYCFIMAEGVSAIRAGDLSHIAPSVLKILGIDKPAEMNEALF